MNTTALISDERYKNHTSISYHPECPERCDAVMQGIFQQTSEENLLHIPPRFATEDEIALCHTREYIETVKDDVVNGRDQISTGDTYLCEQSFEIAKLAVGGSLAAVDAVMSGDARNAFINARPPGHHATKDAGMGFCIFNNIAIACRYAQKEYGIRKVLIIDWDIHHGNGTENIFYDDPTVFYFSTHSWPMFPGTGMAHQTGTGMGKGYTMNVPFPAGTCGSDIIRAMKSKLIPAMKSYRPEIVMVSAGFDCRIADIIGNFALTDESFEKITELCMDIAADYCDGRLVSTLEGGYTFAGLSSAAGRHVKTLSEYNA